jgi:hypothetical protein
MNTTVVRASSPDPSKHLVQFYDTTPGLLVRNVSEFTDEGLQRGESVLIIAAPEHCDAFMSALDDSRGLHMRARQLVVLDAEATLDQFMYDGMPDWRRFEQVIGGTVRGLRRAKPNAGLRAYGEMVGILWAAGRLEAALQLEKFWNALMADGGLTLFCGYPIDLFADDVQVERMHDVLCAHTHVLPSGVESAMELALDRSMREVLGEQTESVRQQNASATPSGWGAVSGVEAALLLLRRHQPQYAAEILSRARTYYRACA